MQIEDQLPERFKRVAFHPTAFVYAWKRKDLEKLFEELMQSNIAISGVEVWLINQQLVEKLIPLKNGQIRNFETKIPQEQNEQGYDFVERSIKEITQQINNWNLEKDVRIDQANNIWYHFQFTTLS